MTFFPASSTHRPTNISRQHGYDSTRAVRGLCWCCAVGIGSLTVVTGGWWCVLRRVLRVSLCPSRSRSEA
ncbi:hypothetical protein FGIG_09697 [Fasciola gigantica]|uniref:Uncharacterized protein n=1 Tax=Fasciola gigantica TaxID=46835 RepID=A0A504YM90_FASGI|nr:hypothetical protein FGIG_09697 [Fasciola gigantica]